MPTDLPIPNPFSSLAGAATKVAADSWTAAMLTVWSAGLWVLRWVLNLADHWLTPDLSENGPGWQVYRYTFWIAAALVLLMLMIQLGVAAVRRDGKSLATALLGAGQFWLVWCAWLGWCVAVMAACAGLTRALMEGLLKIDSWAGFDPFGQLDASDVSDAVVATVLGGLGVFLWLAAIGHILVLLTRAAALLVLAAVTPITAAGLVSEVGRSWFWKSLRWFHAAALTPLVMVLVLGLGIQLATGVAAGKTDSIAAAVGTAIPSVVLICISCFAPLALFRLLAFVDPGTTSGAALRQGLAAHGGIQGVLTGKAGSSGSMEGSSAASNADSDGTSHGESSGETTAGTRFAKAAGGVLGPVGATGVGLMASIGTKGAAIGADLAGQMGVGHGNYYPDVDPERRRRQQGTDRHESRDEQDTPGSSPEGPDDPAPGAADGGPGPAQISDPGGSPTSPAAAVPAVALPAGRSNQGGDPGADGQDGAGKGGSTGGGAGPTGGAAGGAEGAAAAAV